VINTGIQNKVALITGASRGIGKAIALAFAHEGARLAICARDERLLAQTADEIQHTTHADVITIKSNLTKLNDIRRFVEAAVKKYDRLDILVNNAGTAHAGDIFTTTDADWEQLIQLKLLGYIRLAREVIPHMKKNNGGRIINIVGMAGKEPSMQSILHGVINAALLNFTKSLSKELENDAILVNSINPGTVETDLTTETFETIAKLSHKTPAENRQATSGALPQSRFISAEEIANAAVFLASNSASCINGVSLNVDAGKSSGLW